MKTTITFIFFLLSTLNYAQPIAEDLTYGVNGYSVKFMADDRYVASALLPDGNLLVGMTTPHPHNIILRRYLADGTLDLTFGVNGLKTYNTGLGDYLTGIAFQPDQKILLYGFVDSTVTISTEDFEVQVIRLNADFSLDTSFADSGVLRRALGTTKDIATAVDTDAQGNIYIAGTKGNVYSDTFLLKYDSNGVADTTFADQGVLILNNAPFNDIIRTVKVQPDGKILTGGGTRNAEDKFAMCLFRIESNGVLDASFGDNGMAMISFPGRSLQFYDLLVKDNGAIVAYGNNRSDTISINITVAQLMPNGQTDTTFGAGSGIVNKAYYQMIDMYPCKISELPDGRLLISGHAMIWTPSLTDDVYLICFNPDGTVDNSFANNGLYTVYHFLSDQPINHHLLPDGSIVFFSGDGSYVYTSKLKNVYTPLGIDEVDKGPGLALYPNPTASTLNISSKTNAIINEILIYNTLGQQVMKVLPALGDYSIDVSRLPVGSYVVKVVSETANWSAQFLKQ